MDKSVQVTQLKIHEPLFCNSREFFYSIIIAVVVIAVVAVSLFF